MNLRIAIGLLIGIPSLLGNVAFFFDMFANPDKPILPDIHGAVFIFSFLLIFSLFLIFWGRIKRL